MKYIFISNNKNVKEKQKFKFQKRNEFREIKKVIYFHC